MGLGESKWGYAGRMRAFLFVATAAWLSLSACGQVTSDVSGTGTGASTSTTAEGSGGTGGASGGAAGTSDTTGGTAGTGGGTGSTSTGEPVVRAFQVDGLYPTVRVFKGDPVNDRCTIVRLALLGSGGGDDPSYAGVARPEGWGVEYVLIAKGFEDCHDFNLAVENELEGAIGASGAVTWRGSPPSLLDIDVTISFAAGAPWVPVEDTISAVGLVVEPG